MILVIIQNLNPKFANRKRTRLENMADSHTVNKFADLIGRGQLSIAAAADISRSVVTKPCFKV